MLIGYYKGKIVYWLIHGHEQPIVNTRLKEYKQFFSPDLGRRHVSPFLLSNSTFAEVHATQIPITAHRWAVALTPEEAIKAGGKSTGGNTKKEGSTRRQTPME